MSPYAFTWGGRLTTEVCAPLDGHGNPFPNASFQLYLIGTTTPPSYFSDRALTTPRSGSPTTDALGNMAEDWFVELVDSGKGPGCFDYWYQGQHFGTVTIQPDPGESEDDLAAAIATLDTSLSTNYYTKAQTDAAIASGGGPGVGAELQVNKNQPNGYIGADSSGLTAYGQLPATVERTTNKNAANGYIGADSGGLLANTSVHVGTLVGTHGRTMNANGSAVAGDCILANTSGGAFTITMPTPSGDNAPITIKLDVGTTTLSITGPIEGSTQTLTMATNKHAVTYVAVGGYWQRIHSYIPLSILARLDVDNDFADHVNYNYRDNQADYTATTATVGTDIFFGRGYKFTNASGCTITLPANGKVGDWIIIGQGSSVQDTIVAATNATFVEPDSYTKTAKINTQLLVRCTGNSDGSHAAYIVSGYTGA